MSGTTYVLDCIFVRFYSHVFKMLIGTEKISLDPLTISLRSRNSGFVIQKELRMLQTIMFQSCGGALKEQKERRLAAPKSAG
jgi:hypothetical protein